jgi:hypothetical protein
VNYWVFAVGPLLIEIPAPIAAAEGVQVPLVIEPVGDVALPTKLCQLITLATRRTAIRHT